MHASGIECSKCSFYVHDIQVIQMVKAKAGMRLDAEGFALMQCVGDRGTYRNVSHLFHISNHIRTVAPYATKSRQFCMLFCDGN